MHAACLRIYMKAQGAIESSSRPTAGTLLAQGATEYLVLLAVVLIVALVSVALLGFFPGMATDAQMTESEIYWKSAQPIQVVEWVAAVPFVNPATYPFFRVRNVGMYPIRITGIVGSDGGAMTRFYTASTCGYGTYTNISELGYLGPGGEAYFGTSAYGSGLCNREIWAYTTGSTGGTSLKMNSVCQNSSSAPGALVSNIFGFDYIEYIDNQQITKRQIGSKPLALKCRNPW